MRETARRALVASAIFVGVVVLALALWKLKLLIALLFFGFIIAAAMRPGVDLLHRHRIPRVVGVLLHYAALLGMIALILYFVVPVAQTQISEAVPTSRSELRQATRQSTGIRHEILKGIQ